MRGSSILLVLVTAIVGPATATSSFRAAGRRLLAPVSVGIRSAAMHQHASSGPGGVAPAHAASILPRRSSVEFLGNKDLVTMTCESSRGGAQSSNPANQVANTTLRRAYLAAGAATTAAWSTMVYTTIRSNQPQGAMMPCWQHGVFARIGAMSAAGLIAGSCASLALKASSARTWDDLGNDASFRRHSLALATTGVASSLWVKFADVVTRIPGSGDPLLSHQSYSGSMQAKLIGCYGTAAALGAYGWIKCLPEDVRKNPLSWPGRIVDGVSQSLLRIAPKDTSDLVQNKYSLLTSSFLIFTAMQTICNMPIAVIPSWTSRRLSRAFPIYTFLGAVTAFDLKEATEQGRILTDESSRLLSAGVRSFGGLYLGARAGAALLDPSFPKHFGMVNQVPGLAVMAILMVGLSLRSDKK